MSNLYNRETFSLIAEKDPKLRIEDLRITIKDSTGDIVESFTLENKQFKYQDYNIKQLTLEPLQESNLISTPVNSVVFHNSSFETHDLSLTVTTINELNEIKNIDIDFCDFFSLRGSKKITNIKIKNLSDKLTQKIKIITFI